MEKDSVSIAFVRAALTGVQARGLDPAPLLAAAGISGRLLALDAARVSAQRFSALWLAVAAALDDEFFDLDRRPMKVGSFATLCHLGIGAPTLGAALRRALRLLRILLDDTAVDLVLQPAQARLQLRPTPEARAAQRPLQPFAHETLLVLLHGLMCWLIGRRIEILAADFGYPAPAHWPEYRAMYTSRLRFGQEQTAIAFDAALLEAPVVQDTASARLFLREAPYNIVLKYKDAHSWSARVRHALRDLPPAQWPSFEALAAGLQVSPSVLRRGLAREHSSFRAIKDALRRDLAIERLSHSAASLPDIARAVGFAETSAFHRAFKQWTGARPGEYRRRHAPPAR